LRNLYLLYYSGMRWCNNTLSSNLCSITRQVVTYGRLKTKGNFRLLVLKVNHNELNKFLCQNKSVYVFNHLINYLEQVSIECPKQSSNDFCYWFSFYLSWPSLHRKAASKGTIIVMANLLACGGWARSTIGCQNFGVLTKRYDNSFFLRS